MMTMSLEKSLRKCEGFKVHTPDDKAMYVCIHTHTFIPVVSFSKVLLGYFFMHSVIQIRSSNSEQGAASSSESCWFF